MSRNSRSHRILVSLKCPPPGNRDMVAPKDIDKEKNAEAKRRCKFYNLCLNTLKQKGIQFKDVKPFMSLLRKYSLKEYCHKVSDYCGILKKEDRKELLDFLYEQTETKNSTENRSITRADYNIEDAILTNFAVDYPDLMREIAMRNFSDFSFCSKINKKDKVIKKWNSYIDELQNLVKNPNLVTEVNENVNTSSIPIHTNSNQEVLQSTNSNQEVLQSTNSNQEVLQSTNSNQEVLQLTNSNQEILQSTNSNQEILQSTNSNQEILQSTIPYHEVLQSTNPYQEVLQSTNDTSIPLLNHQQTISFNEIQENLSAFNRMPFPSPEYEIRNPDDDMFSDPFNLPFPSFL